MIAVSEARTETRTNMFVMAAIRSAAAEGPVKIRNLSPGGALIEGAVLPSINERFELRRGSLGVAGTVSWRTDERAGLRFDVPVRVRDWLPQGSRKDQQMVDAMIHQVRASAPTLPAIQPAPVLVAGAPDRNQILSLIQGLEELGDELAMDPALIERLGTKLQILDRAAQLLSRLCAETHRSG